MSSGLKRNIQEIYGSSSAGGPQLGSGLSNSTHHHNGNNSASNNNNTSNGNGTSLSQLKQDTSDMQQSSLDPNSNQELKKSRLDNQLKQDPSRVLHLRNIPQQLTENEIIFLGLSFGNIKNVLFLRSKNQAFLEFENLNDAQLMIAHFNQTTSTFSGKKIFVQYSNHQELNTDPNNSNNLAAQSALNEALSLHRAAKQGGKNTVLRATIINMIYPVTLDVLNQIFSKFGVLLKIITFNKNDKYQALIQMRDSMSAQNAKQSLQGQNIYNGCCTLQIEFSKLTTLEVRYNNDKSRDYTNLLLPTGDGQGQPANISSISNDQSMNMNMSSNHQSNNNMSGPNSGMSHHGSSSGLGNMNLNGNSVNQLNALQYQQQSLIGNPPNIFAAVQAAASQLPFGNQQHHQNLHMSSQNQFSQPNFNLNQLQGMLQGAQSSQMHHNQQQHQNQNQQHNNQQMGNSGQYGTPVLLVSNLNEEFVTPDALFTLFGVYGDVIRVKILFNKKDTALINFANSQQASTALANLDRIKLWNKQIRVFTSKHLTVQMPKDGQPDAGLTKDFSNSPLHRFKKPGSKNFNNIFPPSQTLHLSNIPQNVQEQQLRDIFVRFGTIKGFKFFQKDRKMALLQMSTIEEATNALIATHNYQLADNMHLRVTFSKATI